MMEGKWTSEQLSAAVRAQLERGPRLQRVIQLSAGLLLLAAVLVTVLTLVLHTRHTTRHTAAHTDPAFQQSLLVRRLQAATAPPAPPLVFISVKTSKQFHESRLAVVLKTWFQLSKQNTWFFTDFSDEESEVESDGHLVVTSCPSDHSRQALSCKMQAEFDMFLTHQHSWFCHFDDDQYVNVAALEEKLAQYDSREDWYLGKPSIERPLEIIDRDSPELKKISFWFATGGAGFCLSRGLAERMRSIAAAGRFSSVADRMRLPDDVTMGYVVELLAGVKMTRVDQFHSHLEPLRLVSDLERQISVSYSSYGSERNVVEVDGALFSESEDPTRFESLHCRLHPATSWCAPR